uniref:Homeobox protein 13-like n=1 Tax=Dermatophagoides pteronyssinus TaxID=6956 RepID=A0A6P6YGZ6_DERPT|nr:homeobox protein 13-like [Dermatophagoides pteronyssinus]
MEQQQQQQSNNQQQKNDSIKLQRELFYKQQQQQRLQQHDLTRNKDLSADQLIKNILEKVDTDAKITKFYNTHHYQQQQQQQQQQLLNVNTQQFHQNQPCINDIHSKSIETIETTTNYYSSSIVIPQCFYLHSEIPEIYLKIWQSVQCNSIGNNESEFCDRDRLYQILITSNLSNDVLAKLWSFVNRTKPGELTRNELFVLLALVSLVQQNVSNPLQELYSIQTIPVPYFSYLFPKPLLCQQSSTSTIIPEPLEQNEQNIFQSSRNENEFCEFKSASTIVDDKQEINKPFPVDDFIEPPKYSTLNPIDSIITEDLLFEVSTPNTSQEQMQLTNSNNNEDDDFGDFIQTELIETFNVNEENPTNNDFDDQEDLFATNVIQPDSNEQNEFEDKYSFFRKFQNEISSVQEEFGDFHSQPIEQECLTNHQEIIPIASTLSSSSALFKPEEKSFQDKKRIKERILTAIKQVMHKTFNVLAVNHDEASVIETLSSKQGHSFANDLYQVYKIVERIKFAIENNNDNDVDIDKCRTLVDEIDRNWNSIHNLMKKASITLNDCIDSKEFHYKGVDNDEKCWICSTRVIWNCRVN